MSNRIDCSIQSHAACFAIEEVTDQSPASDSASPADAPASSYYDCMNDCISSLGVPQLLANVVTGLGCYAALPACPVLISGAAGAVLGWCDAQCEQDAGVGKR
jgi:hypothetical protein